MIHTNFSYFSSNCVHSVYVLQAVFSVIWELKFLYHLKGLPRQADVTLGVPGRLKPRIFSTFDTTRVVGRQPNAPAAFTSGEIPCTHFQRLSRPQGAWFCRKEPRKRSQVTPPEIDPGTFRLVAIRLNHYATPGPLYHLHYENVLHSLSSRVHTNVQI
jgi:hypothetical protein